MANSTSTTEPVTPFAEGIYAITSTGRESHLAYQLTVPSSIGEIQKELGLHEKGSFVVSAKNPDTPSPGNAGLDNPAKYPAELQKKFRGLRWMPLEPELLAYEGTQFLLIGEAMGELGKSVEEMSKDKRDGEKEKPEEEMEKLEEEVITLTIIFGIVANRICHRITTVSRTSKKTIPSLLTWVSAPRSILTCRRRGKWANNKLDFAFLLHLAHKMDMESGIQK